MHGHKFDPILDTYGHSPVMGKVVRDITNVESPQAWSPSSPPMAHMFPDGNILHVHESDKKHKGMKGVGVVGKSIEEELCRICGDRASGYHYNALSCEGCKGFFRRSITKNLHYKCKNGSACEMDMWMRRKCQACRFKRCREVGMKDECLLSEDQCRARDARRKAKKKHVTVKKADPVSNSTPVCFTPQLVSPTSDVKPILAPGFVISADPMAVLMNDHQHIIRKLIHNQLIYEQASDQEIEDVTVVSPDNGNKEASANDLMRQMIEIIKQVIILIVQFAKSLPGFLSLKQVDQITLLKGAACEVMAIRAARFFDLKTNSILFVTGQPVTLENYKAMSVFNNSGGYAELLYEFCRSIAGFETDDAEYALITAICIFQERHGLVDLNAVEEIQQKYLEVLQAYEHGKRFHGGTSLAILLSKLTFLRTLSWSHSKVLINIKNSSDLDRQDDEYSILQEMFPEMFPHLSANRDDS